MSGFDSPDNKFDLPKIKEELKKVSPKKPEELTSEGKKVYSVYQKYTNKPDFQASLPKPKIKEAFNKISSIKDGIRVRTNRNSHCELKNKLEITPISKDFFDQHFNQKSLIKQGAFGNCYFVAALRSLMNSPKYKQLIMSSVRVGSADGKIKKIYIQMPLGEPKGERISVEHDDFGKQEALVNGKRTVKYGLNGPLGVRSLEVAYNEFVAGKDNPNLTSMEGGFSSYALRNLLGKENLSMFNYVIKGGGRGEPEFRNKGAFKLEDAKFEQKGNQQIYNLLANYDTNKTILTAGTSGKGGSDKNTFNVGGKMFHYRHAYTVDSVQRIGHDLRINVINPHDTSKIISVSFEEFVMIFQTITGGNFTQNFMDNKTSNSTTIAVDTKNRRK